LFRAGRIGQRLEIPYAEIREVGVIRSSTMLVIVTCDGRAVEIGPFELGVAPSQRREVG